MKAFFSKLIAVLVAAGVLFLFVQKRSIEHSSENLAKQAYTYLFPLIKMDRLKTKQTSQWAPINKFHHFRKLLTYKDRFVVSPNNDTLYSAAWIDLSKEPLILHVPDTNGRYYVMPFMDGYTNNFKCIGSRTTGTKENYYALVGPYFRGSIPEGVEIINYPTNIGWIIGRTLVNGEKDIPNVAKIQDEYTLTPLSEYKPGEIGANDYGNWKPHTPTLPNFNKNPLAFFKKGTELLKDNPVPKNQKRYFSRFKKIGLTEKGFDEAELSQETKKILVDTITQMPKELKRESKSLADAKIINNWKLKTGKVGTYGNNFQARAVIATGYIGALVPQEATYPVCYNDSMGNPLVGKNKYVLHFAKDNYPPVKAFWSITLYDAKDFFLVQNPIGRYSIGNGTKGIEKNPDGSLDIYIQHEKPTDLHQLANWLPAPQGNFYLILRMYIPEQKVLEGNYMIPGVEKVK